MNFQDALGYLLGLGNEILAMKLGLENIARLLERLGDPHRAYPSVQIAGTNGKGSVAAMLDSICRAAGVRTGLYTSPHLVSVTERVKIAGRDISREEFARIATEVRAAAEEIERESGSLPTFFEQATAIAFQAFRDARAELAILETGLGGRLDAATVAKADVVAITSVALDHQKQLGDTLAMIAAEKAAIIHKGASAVVTAEQETEAARVISERCRECGVQAREAPRSTFAGQCDALRLRYSFKTGRASYENVCLALRGRHQAANASVAIALAEALAEQGFPIEREHIIEGLERAEHAGRLELIEGEPAFLLDGAHNAAAARALSSYLNEFVKRRVTLVFGVMRDKDVSEIAEALFPAAERLVLTEPRNRRAMDAGEIVRAIPRPTNLSTITVAPDVRDALTIARSITPKDGTICVTGSLYLVGEAKEILG